jgi:hypothetical protein
VKGTTTRIATPAKERDLSDTVVGAAVAGREAQGESCGTGSLLAIRRSSQRNAHGVTPHILLPAELFGPVMSAVSSPFPWRRLKEDG